MSEKTQIDEAKKSVIDFLDQLSSLCLGYRDKIENATSEEELIGLTFKFMNNMNALAPDTEAK